MTQKAGPLVPQVPPHGTHFGLLLRLLLLLALLYLFILSITLLGASFKLFGKEFTHSVFQATSNPLVALMIGVLGTSIVQSSSTTTSLIVGLVATEVIPFESAVPMVMGANIGTSITNTLVSLAHLSRRDEFRRAFAASIVHDFFNICSVILLLTLQVKFNLIGSSAHLFEGLFIGFGGASFSSPLAAISKPVAKQIIALTGNTAWIAAALAGLFLFIALRYIVILLKSMVLAKVEKFFQRYVFRTPILGLVLGMVLTAAVQSSSITTSLVVPLIGAGVITLSQVYPYLLGANLGTTITAFLASFVTGSHEAVSVAFAHTLFNTYGILIFWPLKRIPIFMAVSMAKLTQKSRLIPLAYILLIFFIVPALVIFLAR